MLSLLMLQVATIFGNGFEQPEPVCVAYPAKQVTWQKAWSSPNGLIQAVYPNSIGFPVPIGATKGFPTAIYWTPRKGETVSISFDRVQASPITGYNKPRPAELMTLAISECPGNFEVAPACTITEAIGGLTWSTEFTASTVCTLDPGKMYWLNVRADLCADVPNSATGCDVNASHRQVQ